MKLIMRLIILFVAIMLLTCSCTSFVEGRPESEPKVETIKVETAHPDISSNGSYLGVTSEREYICRTYSFDDPIGTYRHEHMIRSILYQKNGISYRLFFTGSEATPFVINETKEQLEIELIKLQIANLTK